MLSSPTPSGQLWQALDRVHALMARQVYGTLADCGLTVPQYRVLRLLDGAECLSASVLAEALGVTPGNLTGVLDRLEAAGHLSRARDPQDRRTLRVQLTAAGRDHIRRCVPTVRRHIAELFSPLGEAELARTLEVLNRLEAHLTERPLTEIQPTPEAEPV